MAKKLIDYTDQDWEKFSKNKTLRGRPRKWPEKKINQTHRMTPKAHRWIEENRERIEEAAHQVKLFDWR